MNDFHLVGSYIRRFLIEIVSERNLSTNTQKSYRDTFRSILHFMEQRHKINPTRLTVEDLTTETVREFLCYLEKDRGNSVATRNQRLAAIHSFFRFVGYEAPELLELATEIQNVPLRKSPIPTMAYLEKNEMDALLATPDRSRPQGQRDYALLLFLYNSGSRAGEAARTTVGDLNLGESPSVRILGKGNKTRFCPLWRHTSQVLSNLLGTRVNGPPDAPAFLNVRGNPITRYGIHTLVERTVAKAAEKIPSLRDKPVSPHTIRHTTAVFLLRAGVDIN